MSGRKGGSGKNFSCQEYVVGNPGNPRVMDSPAFISKEEVDIYLGGHKIICLECGGNYINLATHIRWSHKNMTCDDYREKYKIPYGRALMGVGYLNALSNQMLNRYNNPDEKKAFLSYAEKGRKKIIHSNIRKPLYKQIGANLEQLKGGEKGRLKATLIKTMRFRPQYLAALRISLHDNIRLSEACKLTGVFYHSTMNYIKKHPEDKEIQELYILVPKKELPKGVRIMPNGKYQARIAINKIMKHLGTFDTIEKADKVLEPYRKAKEDL